MKGIYACLIGFRWHGGFQKLSGGMCIVMEKSYRWIIGIPIIWPNGDELGRRKMQQGLFFSILVLLCDIHFFLVQVRISVIWRSSAEKEGKKKQRVAILGHITCLGEERVRIIFMAYIRREVEEGGHRSIPTSAISINFPRVIVWPFVHCIPLAW